MTRRLLLAIVTIAMTIIVHHQEARAGAAGALVLNHTWLQSRGDASASGFGAEYGIISKREPFMMTFGGFYALGKADAEKRVRDVYAVRWGFGLKPKVRRPRAVIPFVSVGLDFLHITTRMPDSGAHAGMTLGFDARGGVFGVVGKRWVYQISASYIGAIVPGTGEGLDGVALQIGIGKALF